MPFINATAHLLRDEEFNVGSGYYNTNSFTRSVLFGASYLNDIKILGDNSYYTAGHFGNYQFGSFISLFIQKSQINGNIDKSFNFQYLVSGSTVVDDVYEISILDDNKILASTDIGIFRVNTNGRLDTTFTNGVAYPGFNTNTRVYTSCINNDGTITIGGTITGYSSNSVGKICKINSDGTFNSTPTIGFNSNTYVYKIKKQSSGKYIVLTKSTTLPTPTYSGITITPVIRLNTDFTFDNTFSLYSYTVNRINNIEILPDDSILLATSSSDIGVTNYNLIKLDNNGNYVSTSNFATSDTVGTYSIKSLKNNKILIGGNYGIRQLNSDLTLDNSFTAPTLTNPTYLSQINVKTFQTYSPNNAIVDNTNILAGGDFTYQNTTIPSPGIIKLNSNGTCLNKITSPQVNVQFYTNITYSGYTGASMNGVGTIYRYNNTLHSSGCTQTFSNIISGSTGTLNNYQSFFLNELSFYGGQYAPQNYLYFLYGVDGSVSQPCNASWEFKINGVTTYTGSSINAIFYPQICPNSGVAPSTTRVMMPTSVPANGQIWTLNYTLNFT